MLLLSSYMLLHNRIDSSSVYLRKRLTRMCAFLIKINKDVLRFLIKI